MKHLALLTAALLALTAQTSAPQPRHLEYKFGYNTKVTQTGRGTGTTSVDIVGPAKDGGVIVTAADHWWNTARPQAKNTCEVYPNGRVSCSEAPYAISPIQLTIFPLLAANYFSRLSSSGHSSWKQTYEVYAAIVPGAAGFAGQPNTWNAEYAVEGKGPVPNGGGLILVESKGTLRQQGGRYLKANDEMRIGYDPVTKIPVIVSDVRTHIPMSSVYSNDVVEVKLTKDSAAAH